MSEEEENHRLEGSGYSFRQTEPVANGDLRALVMAIEGLTPDEILAREIGTGEPTIYKIGPDGKLVERVTL